MQVKGALTMRYAAILLTVMLMSLASPAYAIDEIAIETTNLYAAVTCHTGQLAVTGIINDHQHRFWTDLLIPYQGAQTCQAPNTDSYPPQHQTLLIFQPGEEAEIALEIKPLDPNYSVQFVFFVMDGTKRRNVHITYWDHNSVNPGTHGNSPPSFRVRVARR